MKLWIEGHWRTVKAILCAAILTATTASALAQPGAQPPQEPPPQPTPPQQPYPPQQPAPPQQPYPPPQPQQQPPPQPQQPQPYPPQQPQPYPQQPQPYPPQQPQPYPPQQPYGPQPYPQPQPSQRDGEQPPAYGRPYTPYARPQLSESTALWWSLGGTIGAYGLIALGGALEESNPNSSAGQAAGTIGGLGVFLAPGFGHWYAGKYWTRGLGLRLGSIGVLFGGLLMAVAASDCPLFYGGHDGGDCEESAAPGAIAVATLLTTAGMFVWGTVDDIVDAPRRARRINEASAQGFTLTLAPLRAREATGLALVGRW